MIHPSTQAMLDFEPTGTFTPVAATREMLLSMEKADVFVVQWPASALGYDFYRNMMPEVPAVPVVERAGKPAPRPPPLPTPVSLTAPCRRCPSCCATRATTSSTRRTGTWR